MAVKSLLEMDIQREVDKINKLALILIKEDRIDDLYKSCTDREYQKQLIKDYNIE